MDNQRRGNRGKKNKQNEALRTTYERRVREAAERRNNALNKIRLEKSAEMNRVKAEFQEEVRKIHADIFGE